MAAKIYDSVRKAEGYLTKSDCFLAKLVDYNYHYYSISWY